MQDLRVPFIEIDFLDAMLRVVLVGTGIFDLVKGINIMVRITAGIEEERLPD